MSLPIFLFRTMYPRRGEEWVSTHANWPLCLMLRIGMRETEPAVAVENNSPDNLQLIVPNLHRRYSGVTATNRMVAPKLARMFRAAWLGSNAPDGIERMGIWDLAKLWRSRTPLIWHARRNNEMIAGVLLRSLGWPLKLVVTSAAQRHHSWIMRRHSRSPGCRAATRSAASAGCARRKAATCSWTPCAGCCRAIPTSPLCWSARSRLSTWHSRTG